MKLTDLIIPTKIGTKGDEVLDLLYLPTYEELKDVYHLSKQDLIVDEKSSVSGKFWLRNEIFKTVIFEPRLDVLNGYVENQTGNHKVIITYENINNHQATNDFILANSFGVRPCMRFDVNAYANLVANLEANHDRSHSPYQVKDYMCLKFGEYHGRNDLENKRPIEWRILNWHDLPKSINPKGNGKATTLDLFSVNILEEMPYQTSQLSFKHENQWQKSLVRSFLNGYVNTIGRHTKDFRNHSFFSQAFKNEKDLLNNIPQNVINLGDKQSNKKEKLAINHEPSVLKQEFIKAIKTNPEALKELLPVMKEFISAVESLSSHTTPDQTR